MLCEPWAEVQGYTKRNGGEEVIGEALQGVAYYRIRIRYRGDIKASDQVRFGALDLNITAAYDPDGLRKQLLIVADTASALPTS